MQHHAFLVREYLMGDFSTKWAHKADKNKTTSDLNLSNCVSVVSLLFFSSDNSILMRIEELTWVALLWKEGSLNVILDNIKQVFVALNFLPRMKLDVNKQMSSNDLAMNSTIGFSVWYSTSIAQEICSVLWLISKKFVFHRN